jgi:DNA segregation ATPase FtsK/SpoIIIE, S-DNA-T family
LASRSALVDLVAADIARARWQARVAVASADEQAIHAEAELATARATAERLFPDLAGVRDAQPAASRSASERRRAEVVAGLAALTATMPAAVVADWPTWNIDAAAGRRRAPEWLRIGALAAEPGIAALVPLLDLGHLAIDGSDPAACDAVIAGLLLRAVGGCGPGAVRMSVYDPDGLGGTLSGFAPLRAAGLLRFVGPGGLDGLLDDVVAHIRRVNERVLAGSYATLREYAAATGRRPEPWHLVVLLGRGSGPVPMDQLDRVVRTGAACGVHLITRGVPVRASGNGRVETVHIGSSGASCTTTGGVRLDAAPPADLVIATTRLIADLATAGPTRVELRDLLPEKFWTESSAYGLSAPVGIAASESGAGEPLVPLHLGDHPPHALIGGPSGSGKTNLIYAWLASLTARYSPDELALYLLDFKEGVSFARFAPSEREPSWLPHVRLVGVNINNDREFGLALLRFLADELRRRAAAARTHGATKLPELRTEDPGGHWPRIVTVIDEFQVLLAHRDAVTAEAVTLLEDLARRGRSQGIHLVLASQDVAGIEALWGRSALVGQFALRVALPKARRILSDTNLAAEDVPRFHAVVNAEGGAPEANRITRLCDASKRDAATGTGSGPRGSAGWDSLQRQMFGMRGPLAEPPRLFDGDATPRLGLATCVDVPRGGDAVAIVGARIDVTERPATMTFGRTPGRNIAVLGSRREDACAILAAVAWSVRYGVGAEPGADPWSDRSDRLHVIAFDPAARTDAAGLGGRLHDDGDTLLAALREPADGPRFVIGYAMDAAPAPFRAAVRDLLHGGPERGIHVVGWWRTVPRLRDDLGGVAARTDAVGAWVALDVHGSELTAFCPIPGGPAWYPRRHRALFFDRAVHRTPEILIPYEVTA